MSQATTNASFDPSRDDVIRRSYRKYLERYHELSQHMLGLVSVNADPELMGKLRPYRDDIQREWIRHLLASGVPIASIGSRSVFHADDALVDEFRRDSDASLAEDAQRLSPEGVAARAEGIAQ